MSIQTRESHHSSDCRQVDVRGDAHSTHPCDAPAVDALLGRVSSSRYDQSEWTPPLLCFQRADSGRCCNFTRGEWETVKRQVDAAFDLFERTWPLDGEPQAVAPGARVELAALDRPAAAKFITRPFAVGERGRVVRIVHVTVEGEPLDEQAAHTLVHVLFDGREDAIAFHADCLRRVEAQP